MRIRRGYSSKVCYNQKDSHHHSSVAESRQVGSGEDPSGVEVSRWALSGGLGHKEANEKSNILLDWFGEHVRLSLIGAESEAEPVTRKLAVIDQAQPLGWWLQSCGLASCRNRYRGQGSESYCQIRSGLCPCVYSSLKSHVQCSGEMFN